ncbi:hypothetical protein ACQ4M3_15105 [Leptolyngbya sp. AN03gr2]|uniref:hypothetical protein n=1 Tax=unclassified Leptolyngbya TaxID=2650499 RepID=UPI003D3169CA
MTSHLVPSNTLQTYRAIAEQTAALYLLPDSQQLLLAWLNQQESASLEEIAAHLGQSEEIAETIVDRLIEQGFIEAIETSSSESRSRIGTQGSAISPLSIIVSPSSHYAIAAGSTFDLSVTVFNRGNENAIVDVFIDETAQALRQWCVSPSERLALGAGESNEVIFTFHIPIQILPATYSYQLVIDAPQHYPEDTPIQFTKTLQILPPTGTITQANDPTFALKPATTSSKPAIVQPGGTLDVRIEVFNRSDRVDQFYLNCSDLQKDWYAIHYPENLEGFGLITSNHGLRLNPNTKGEILLSITPAIDTPAGRNSPTIELISTNNPALNLLDVIHFEIAPIHLLNAELHTLVSKVRNLPGVYQVKLLNSGNTARKIALNARSLDEDEADLYQYRWDDASIIELSPKQTQTIGLQVKPQQWWKRPLIGSGKTSNFAIALEDARQLPLPPDPLQGTIVWKARPFWQLLLLLLTAGGAIAAIIFAIWFVFFKPNAAPKITLLTASELSYNEAKGSPIRLNWQISNPKRIERLQLLGRAQGNLTVLSEPVMYDFSRGIPKQLEPYCTIAETLTCRNVPTDARKAGDYVFELQATLRDQQSFVSKSTDTIQIQPIVPPKIQEFSAVVARPNSDEKQPVILQRWKINQADQLGELRLIGRAPDGSVTSPLMQFNFAQGIPRSLQPFCTLAQELVCQNLALPVSKFGNQVFELTVIPKNGSEPSDSKKTDTLSIEPAPPKIRSFQINGQDARPKYLLPIDPDQPLREITLAWEIEPAEGIKVELPPTPGTVPLKGSLRYPISPTTGKTTLTLQVTNASGKSITRSIELEFFNPDPTNPTVPPTVLIPPPAPTNIPPIAPPALPLTPPAARPPQLPIDSSNPAPSNVPPRFN